MKQQWFCNWNKFDISEIFMKKNEFKTWKVWEIRTHASIFIDDVTLYPKLMKFNFLNDDKILYFRQIKISQCHLPSPFPLSHPQKKPHEILTKFLANKHKKGEKQRCAYERFMSLTENNSKRRKDSLNDYQISCRLQSALVNKKESWFNFISNRNSQI